MEQGILRDCTPLHEMDTKCFKIASATRKNVLVWKCVIEMAIALTTSSPCTEKICVIPLHITDFSKKGSAKYFG